MSPNDPIVEFLDGLETLIAEFRARLVSKGLAGHVESGVLLFEIQQRTTKVLDVVKKALRARAIEDLHGTPGTTHYLGDTRDKKASVTIQKPVLQLDKKADMGMLRRVLGENFDRVFETTYKPRKDASTVFGTLPPEQQAILLQVLQPVEETPRVSFVKEG